MKTTTLSIPDVRLFEPKVLEDGRGFFMETFQARRYRDAGLDAPFVQDNLSSSKKAVLRGLHFQYPYPQGKLVSVLQGEVFDVAVDIRRGSPTFGNWVGTFLSGENRHQLWVPEGFAHGFCVTSDIALLAYKCTDYYSPESERCIRWDDPNINIAWPVLEAVLSPKDLAGVFLADLDPTQLPHYKARQRSVLE